MGLAVYIPYICVDVPSNLILKKMRPGFYLPGLLLGWGGCCMVFSSVGALLTLCLQA